MGFMILSIIGNINMEVEWDWEEEDSKTRDNNGKVVFSMGNLDSVILITSENGHHTSAFWRINLRSFTFTFSSIHIQRKTLWIQHSSVLPSPIVSYVSVKTLQCLLVESMLQNGQLQGHGQLARFYKGTF